jgi:DNA-3-methyladenine glycosylase II
LSGVAIWPILFEALVNRISCEQLSLTVGIILLNRLAKKICVLFKSEKGTSYSFPFARKVSSRKFICFEKIGFGRQKGQYLIELSRLVTQKKINLDRLATLNNEDVLNQLYDR